MPAQKSESKKKSSIIFQSVEHNKKIGKNNVDMVEKEIKHHDTYIIIKYFMKNNENSLKVEVRAPRDGKEYTLTVIKNGEKSVNKYKKTELVTALKKMNVQPIPAIEEVNMFKSTATSSTSLPPRSTLRSPPTLSPSTVTVRTRS